MSVSRIKTNTLTLRALKEFFSASYLKKIKKFLKVVDDGDALRTVNMNFLFVDWGILFPMNSYLAEQRRICKLILCACRWVLPTGLQYCCILIKKKPTSGKFIWFIASQSGISALHKIPEFTGRSNRRTSTTIVSFGPLLFARHRKKQWFYYSVKRKQTNLSNFIETSQLSYLFPVQAITHLFNLKQMCTLIAFSFTHWPNGCHKFFGKNENPITISNISFQQLSRSIPPFWKFRATASQ